MEKLSIYPHNGTLYKRGELSLSPGDMSGLCSGKAGKRGEIQNNTQGPHYWQDEAMEVKFRLVAPLG